MIKQLATLISIALLSLNLNGCDKAAEVESNPEVESNLKVENSNETKSALDAESVKAAEAITIVNPRIRALPPGQKVTAMYMQLNNASATARELVRVEAAVSDMIELHTHTNNNGVMEMGQVESIPVPANGSIEAKPGSYHVMIMGLKEDLNLGEKIDFNLIFKDGSNKSITAEVKTLELN